MNNGKVRIYELSKELNLDNREILDVCEQLNIPVKSHSSTISEAEAARIRSAAEKGVQHSVATRSSTPSSTPLPRKDKPQPPIKKKQQILEIRRQPPSAEPPKRPAVPVPPSSPEPVASVSPEPAFAPAPVAATPTQPVPRPVLTKRPARPNEEEVAIEPEEAPVLEAPPQEEVAALQEPVAPVPSAPVPEPKAPSLIGPPVKPSVRAPEPSPAPTPAAPPVATSGVGRPVLKKPSQLRQQPAMDDDTSAPPKRPMVVVKRGQSDENGNNGGRPEATPPVRRDKPVIELRNKPVRPADRVAADGSATAGTVPVADVADLELKRPDRPTPSKSIKRGGRRRDEDEEEREAARVAKPAAKGKRRSQVEIDEDIELDDTLDGQSEEDANAAMVRMSLARPPKPKSSKPAAKPAAIAAPKKKSSSSDGRSHRRDRREQDVQERPEVITLTGGVTVAELAEQLVVPETEIIKALFMKGIMTTVNQMLDVPTATAVAEEFSVLVDAAVGEAEAKKVTEMLDAADMENLHRRPPVVTIMGHVDHGKTTLLDSIRKTKVAQGEAGGITQHIGAYHVDVEHNGREEQVVFLDTPGHEAFTAMRARGARVTDVAVLVVAADDGVRPQTIEAISHAKAAEVPIVVAINKVDKEQANPDRVKQELMEYGLVPEEWGGDTIMVPVSALTGDNLDTLLEMLLLVTEVEDLQANPDRPAKGTVIEANLDKAKGPVATLLVQNGTLRVGDVLVAGSVLGRVRAMVDDRGKRVKEALPSFAVEVLGLSDVPAAGDEFDVYRDEKEARSLADQRTDQQRQSRLQQAMASRRVSLSTLSAQAQEGELKELNLVLKGDVQGSVEAILASLQQLPQKEVQIRVLLAAPGEITETDVDLAAASNAVIIGFNTTFASGARKAADDAGVDVRDYNIIYKLLEDVQGAMEGLLDPELVEEPLGQVEVRAVFPVGKGTVAGCYVQSGKIIRNTRMRVSRNGSIVHEGNLDSLKRMRDDVKEVAAGYECGIGSDDFRDWKEGDIINVYRLVTKRRTLTV
ncbi:MULTISPECIES: translation initiation factor IF-2 [unclassified Leptolyngbya]|uniref:translation initiation factor IF-2 n=1 Tax=unclassified Leptolyngbya TaxID=2650499 RepID=UPI00168664BB|nr:MULTISPECIES: translation initiation factor IF-2 [unclassified Leptolyngbya]MBD1912775.1 translation initiation factor IF-2 [Leptolyngbya sp. FACHB-8]MBD2157722.1 translation initiation factor IF-2 [Leptolyngbya sp. FACHB-16]